MGFGSQTVSVSHGNLNWDTQVRNDFTALQTYLRGGLFTPGFGGTGASIGTSGGSEGTAAVNGQDVIHTGRIVFGVGGSFGTGVPALTGINAYGDYNTAAVIGEGYYIRGGSAIHLFFTPANGSQFVIRVSGASSSTLLTSLGTPAQSEEIRFRIGGTLA